MKIKLLGVYVLALIMLAALYSCSDKTDTLTNSLQKKSAAMQPTDVSVSVFATGLNNPRGLKFGPDGYLYVAEGGLGGTISTAGLCDSVIAPIGPYTGGYTASISKISPTGDITTVADGLPSSQTSPASGSLVSGVADVAFVGNTLYAILAGAGCSHGIEDYPNGIIKVNNDGTWDLVADLERMAAHSSGGKS